MSRRNIPFNNATYLIDDAPLASDVAKLKSHLSSVLNGSGSTVNFDGVSYNIDESKLSDITNEFVSHLRTISGTGYKVIVNGIEYSVDPTKIQDAIRDLHFNFNSFTLDNLYEISYYSTLKLAAEDVSSETVGENVDSNKENAVAGVYTDDNGKVTVIVLKTTNIAETVVLGGDVVLDLNGKSLTSSAATAFSLSGNVVVDATRGGSITMNGEEGVRLCALHFTSGTGAIEGGKYITNSSNVATTRADIGTIVVDNGAEI